MRLAFVLGAASKPGRLAAAVAALREEISNRHPDLAVDLVDLHTTLLDVCDGRPDDAYDEITRAAVAAICAADTVILASPVYRASFPGVLKNFLDLLPVRALRDKPVGLVSMGGSAHHYLGADWQLRAVLTWFGALAMPSSVYLMSSDFEAERLQRDEMRQALTSLAESCIQTAARLAGTALGPAPLAARWS